MVVGLLGGLAVFLFGLDQLTTMLKATAGPRLREVLARATTNRFKGVLAGGFTTAVIQSSSVTTVLVVGFVSAGLMSLQQSIGVIMGAEIGTTITAQIIAFKVTQYALVAVVVGFSMQFFSKTNRIKRYGMIVLGLGLVFYGMNMMGDATRPLRTYQPFIDMLAQMDNRALTILLSASFTALIQSSSATTGVIIVLGSQGLISLEQGIALVLGANIGTCITALLASIGKERNGLQAAMIHVTFNVSGVLLWFSFIDEIAMLSRWLSPSAAELSGMDRLAAEVPRQIANAHTLFNVGNTLIFIWFTGVFAWIVTRLVPQKAPTGPGAIEPRFLEPTLIETPALALDAARREIVRMAGYVQPMVREVGPAVLQGNEDDLDRIRQLDKDVDVLHSAIVRYLGRVSREELTPAETEYLHDYLNIATMFEGIGDIVETDLVHVGAKRIEKNVTISPQTQDVLLELADKVGWALSASIKAVERDDKALAVKVIEAKDKINSIADDISTRLVQRLVAEDPHRTSTFRVESQLIENYKRIYYFTKRIAKMVAVAETAMGGPKEFVPDAL
jgi:phosphate:Na+ symporter